MIDSMVNFSKSHFRQHSSLKKENILFHTFVICLCLGPLCSSRKVTVVVVLRSPIHANEASEYNGMLYRTSNRVLNNGIKVIILICMDGTSQYHHHQSYCFKGYALHTLPSRATKHVHCAQNVKTVRF